MSKHLGDQSFIELGLNAANAAELALRLNEEFGTDIAADKIAELGTLSRLSEFIAGLVAAEPAAAVTKARTQTAPRPATLPTHLLFLGAVEDGEQAGASCLGQRQYTFESQSNICLRDHIVCDRFVMPTDAYLEMIYVGAAAQLGASALQIERMQIAAPLALSNGERRQVNLRFEDFAGAIKFTIESTSPVGSWRNVNGVFRAEQPALRRTARHWHCLDNFEKRLTAEEIYTGEGDSRFGEFYQSIREMRIKGRTAVARLELSPAARDKREEFLLCPPLIDGLFVAALTLARLLAGDRNRLYLPVLLEDIAIPGPLLTEQVDALVEAVEVAPDWMTFRLALVNDDNEVIFSCSQFHAQVVAPADLQGPTLGQLVEGAGNPGPTELRETISTFTPASVAERLPGSNNHHPREQSSYRAEGIAVIGMAGRFPDANSPLEFWSNLAAGVDSITEVPAERWDGNRVFDSDPKANNKSYSRVGGFIREVDCFDPLFFNISPAEAELMDPQQRLFLMEAWRALEDAGYSAERLAGVKCGVFVGASTGDYMHRLGPQEANSSQAFTGLATSILAARISYFLNLTGPSIAIDTACSSSLVAVREAISSLQSGDSELALAGGVALLLSPDLHIKTGKTGMLSPTGRCRSFDRAADGIVLGEGVGVVVLKPLGKALADRDHIYGVIIGAGANQDGRTNGITAPSGAAQSRLLREVYQRAELDPASISFIEAHGTGTPLGDPIEVEALTTVFRERAAGKQFCALGSVKANIGHTTLAAGSASLIKVLLALKHRQIPPLINFVAPSDEYDLAASPFYINTVLKPWRASASGPLRAGVSSFGFSGTNCHLVVEEAPPRRPSAARRAFELVVVSAKTPEALSRKLAELVDWIEQNSAQECLAELAYTLLRGRSHFKFRVAFITGSLSELSSQMRAALEQRSVDGFVASNVQNHKTRPRLSLVEQGGEILARLHEANWTAAELRERLATLAELYIQNAELDWERLYPERSYNRLSLPTYPFAKDRFWLSTAPTTKTADEGASSGKLHPLVHTNTSTFASIKFTTRLRSDEFFLADHAIGNEKILPGVAYLEMARAAGELVAERPVRKMRDVIWAAPLIVTDRPAEIEIRITPKDGDAIFEIVHRQGQDEEVLCGRGKLVFATRLAAEMMSETVDLARLRAARAPLLSGAEFYERVTQRGLHLGPSFRAVESLQGSALEVLARLRLPSELRDGFSDFVLHPSILDGALQTGLADLRLADEDALAVPFTLAEIELLGSLNEECWAYALRPEDAPPGTVSRLEILDDQGRVLLRIKDLLARPLPSKDQEKLPPSTIFVRNQWQIEGITQVDNLTEVAPLLLFDHDAHWQTQIKAPCGLVTPGTSFRRTGKRSWEIDPRQPADYQRLARELAEGGLSPAAVLHRWSDEPFSRERDGQWRPPELAVRSLFLLLRELLAEAPKAPRRLLHLYAVAAGESSAGSDALSGFAKAVALEAPRVVLTTLECPAGMDNASLLAAALAELQEPSLPGRQARYRDGERQVLNLEEFAFPEEQLAASPFAERGIYLISGGLGRLGLLIARHLAEEVRAGLVLVGRSEPGHQQWEQIRELEALGAEVMVSRADVTQSAEVGRLIKETKARFGRLDGVIQAAAVTHDALLRNKRLEDFDLVLAAKVRGTMLLDEATSDEDLRFFALFSSLAAQLGNRGQCDYAYANRFLDCFATWREQLHQEGRRAGRTISVNWPLWARGGLRGDAASEKLAAVTLGLSPLETKEAWQIFRRALSRGVSPLMVLCGDPLKLRQKLQLVEPPAAAARPAADGELMTAVTDELVRGVCEILKLKPQEIELDQEMNEYGFNSINVVSLANHINETYLLDITPAMLFEHSSLDSLARYLITNHAAAIQRTHIKRADEPHAQRQHWPPLQGSTVREAARPAETAQIRSHPESLNSNSDDRAVAIVGISGVMPQSPDLQAFWNNLVTGLDLITEIPRARWDWRDYAGEAADGTNRTNVRWGGFMPEVDKFDPLFFGISPREAELMDPQQRMILEAVWKAIEDSGTNPSDLSGTNTGVFVGVSTADYGDLLREQTTGIGAHSSTGMAHSVLVNRISYLLNLSGPSEPVDTACSSSLVALHRAVQEIRRGACESAIVGGVSILLSPTLFISFAQAGMLSEDGRCRSFDRSASGYVRGEGVGAMLLKPLKNALRDRNPIYAVVRGTAVNHGGRASSLTAPNPNAQAALLLAAFEDAGIDPAQIGYIEAHGTGTPLGDPIEINAIKKAFADWREQHGSSSLPAQRCRIGSVKSNIGHLEAAAGLAGIFKTLLAMKHRRIPASLHIREINPQIRLGGTHFEIVDRERPWEPLQNQAGRALPLCAGVSSFGFGGVNAHVVLESFEPSAAARVDDDREQQLIVLSARNKDRLRAAAGQLASFLDKGQCSLRDLAYTLQVGREAMTERLAFIAHTIEEVIQTLKRFAQNEAADSLLWRGHCAARRKQRAPIADGEDERELLRIAMRDRNLEKLGALWTVGHAVDWEQLHAPLSPRRISLPTYPFARERYWIPEANVGAAGLAPARPDERTREQEPVRPLLYERRWVSAEPPEGKIARLAGGAILLFGAGKDLRPAILEVFRRAKQQPPPVIFVRQGDTFSAPGQAIFTINPRRPEDYVQLMKLLADQAIRPETIINLWPIERVFQGLGDESDEEMGAVIEAALARSARPMFYLVKALAATGTRGVRRCLVVGRGEDAPDPFFEMLSGFGRALGSIGPAISFDAVQIIAPGCEPQWIAERLLAEAASAQPGQVREIRYRGNLRSVRENHPLQITASGAPAVRPGGVYLITGGGGALGRHIARRLARTAQVRLALIGRSPLDNERERELRHLEEMGAEAIYLTADVGDLVQMRAIVAAVHEQLGPVHGVIHAAGQFGTTPLPQKEAAEFEAVLRPKIAGSIVLDFVTKHEPLDFFLSFSSVASVLGDLGRSDYAVANRFVDAFAAYREEEYQQGRRRGRTMAIAWPLWRDGGMHPDPERETESLAAAGLTALETEDGLRTMDELLGSGVSHALVLNGDPERVNQLLEVGQRRMPEPTATTVAPVADADLLKQTEQYLLTLFAGEFHLPEEQLDLDADLAAYGLDSILLNQLTALLSKKLGPLPKTLLLEQGTIREVASYLVSNHGSALRTLLAPEPAPGQGKAEVSSPPPPTAPPTAEAAAVRRQTTQFADREAIAVIGLAGRYPQASTLDQFWENLKTARTAIAEIPASRWDYRKYFDSDAARAADGKIYCKWGAFLDGIEDFDPLFFGIAPNEAKTLKPEERLLLEVATDALEDAGYHRAALAGSRVAVYVGVTANTYPLLGMERYAQRQDLNLDTSFFSLPNRISHHFDFRGPSLAIDTGCSSSLAAIHLACESLRAGSVDLAVAGGVNLILHPSKYQLLCQGLLLSRQAHCEMFAAGGEGFVPGEGAGIALLKPLSRALADGDNIYAVLLGSAVSHKGGRQSYRLPSPNAQAEQLTDLLAVAGVEPQTISYVEPQAIGAEIADAAEWSALTKVFGGVVNNCAIGSLKPNVGHLEAAAGMAQLTKVLLQMKHRHLAPSRLARERNPQIVVEGSPFYFPETLLPWSSRAARGAGHERNFPARALINSFGIGGVQASLLLEAFTPSRVAEPDASRREVVVLSAKTERQLADRVTSLAAYARAALSQELAAQRPRLVDIAFTLQVGREAYRERFAVIVASLEELRTALDAWLRGEPIPCPVFKGSSGGEVTPTGDDDLERLAARWVAGAAVNWPTVSGRREARRISLPTYPYEKMRCWLDDETKPSPQQSERLERPSDGAKATVRAYYDQMAEAVAEAVGMEEVHLIFAPFLERVAGFSWLLTFFEPHRRPAHYELMLNAQRQLKTTLYRHVDFAGVSRVMDIGCGLATDLIDLANRHPHLTGAGYTIASKQAELGRERIRKAGLADRLEVYHRDSTKESFPGRFDLILSCEVLFHIQQKSAVLENVARHLTESGTFLVADCLTNTISEIDLPHLGLFTNTAAQLADLLAQHGLQVADCVDVGPEMGRFLDDPNFEKNLAYLRSIYPATAQVEAEHRGWNNCGKAFTQGLIRYVLLTIHKAAPGTSAASLRQTNQERLANPLTYAAALSQSAAGAASPLPSRPNRKIEREILVLTAEVLGADPGRLDTALPFAEYGVDSLVGLRLLDVINRRYGLRLPMEVLFDHSTVRELSAVVARSLPVEEFVPPGATFASVAEKTAPLREDSSSAQSFSPGPAAGESQMMDIAVIGMAGRFPGAANVATFWRNLKHSVDSVIEVPADRWDLDKFYDPDPNQQSRSYSRWGGFVDDVDKFDPSFFRLTRAEAEVMDPQQRLFLEACWEALEDAGHIGPASRGLNCGVFAGVFNNDYQMLLAKAGYSSHLGQAMLGNAASILAARTCYLLDLKGPALSVDSACSSSLVAVHLACRSLQQRETDLMLAGGVTLYLDESPYIMMSKAGMLSPQGRCKTFDASADGIVTGEGVGVVVLKRLADALADGDHIYGVIRGSGINQDGRTNGITAPSKESQTALEVGVYTRFGIDPATIGYVEAHGTGTKLGDPIEVAALTSAFRQFTDREQFCGLGSVKSNIGHTSAASGVVGLIKVLLSLQHNLIPPTLHVTTANPFLNLTGSPFFICTEAREWRQIDGVPRRAAISAFGFSGTNCHLVVEEAPAPVRITDEEPAENTLIVLSAANEERLRESCRRLADFLRQSAQFEGGASPRLVDLAWTLQTGREAMPERLAFVCRSRAELADKLERYSRGETTTSELVRGAVGSDGGKAGWLEADEDAREMVRHWLNKGKLEKVAEYWANGGQVDWSLLAGSVDYRKVSLPTYPFARERHWFQPPPNVTPARHAPRAITHHLSVESNVLVREHTVFGHHCLPTDGLLDMVYQAAKEQLATGRLCLSQVNIFSPLICVPERLTRADLQLDSNRQPAEFVITSRIERIELQARKNIEGLFATLDQAEENSWPLPSEEPFATLDSSFFRSADHPLQVGEFFHCIEQAQLWDCRAVGHLRLSNAAREYPARFCLHPGILDGVFGVALALATTMRDGQRAAFVPIFIQEFRVYAEITDDVYRVDVRARHETPEFIRFDADLIDRQNRVIVAFRGLDEKRVDPENLARSLPSLQSSVSSGNEAAPPAHAAKVRLKPLASRASVPAQMPLVEPGLPADQLSDLSLIALAAPAAEGASNGKVSPTLSAETAPGAGEETLRLLIRRLLGETLLVEESALDDRQSLIEQGVDSILGLEFVQKLNRQTGLKLQGTVLFENPTVASLVQFLWQHHRPSLPPNLAELSAPKAERGVSTEELKDEIKEELGSAVLAGITKSAAELPAPGATDIAVIGMAARFPGSNTLDELWRNLAEVKYLITEIPADHWDYRPYFQPGSPTNRIYCNRGGFISGVDLFDPLFFNISPREAETMDPQLRHFLEVLWESLEDAGYAGRIRGSHTGLFLGNCYNDYLDLLKQRQEIDFQFAGSGNSNSMLSNRAAFFLDLTGPCLTLDTACSSSLVALHLACQALRQGECSMAIAGGVNLNLSAAKYLSFCALGAFSRSGESRPFSAGADGYLPGEGVAAMLLKPLSAAIQDGDRIYGVIRGSSVRCGGRAAGPTVPNPAQETATLLDAWQSAGINPEMITYLEAHGTGTVIGDPLEINAIKKAFAPFTAKRAFCGLGTIKANIGHTEATAGLAGVIKVLLQMRHRALPGTPNLHPINPMIELEDSPLVLSAETQAWEPGGDGLRRAGVSSFGMGGTYAHVVIEEYPGQIADRVLSGGQKPGPRPIFISARTEERLRATVQSLVEFLERLPEIEKTPAFLADFAYTLEVGREAMEQRLALVVSSVAELERKLRAYLAGSAGVPGLHLGGPNSGSRSGEALRALPLEILQSAAPDASALEEFVSRWAAGATFDASGLKRPLGARLLSLPTYPFERERYWVAPAPSLDGASNNPSHLLLDGIAQKADSSNGDYRVFRKRLRDTDSLLNDHQVGNARVLPGTAALEMAFAAIREMDPKGDYVLSRVVWSRPLVAQAGETEVHVAIRRRNQDWSFEIRSGSTAEAVLHASGEIRRAEATTESKGGDLPLKELRDSFAEAIHGDALYEKFAERGLCYGPTFRRLERVWSNGRAALGRLRPPAGAHAEAADYLLNPALLDAALQTVSVLLPRDERAERPCMPWSVETVQSYHPLTAQGYAYAERVGEARFNVTVANDDGQVCAVLRDVAVREFTPSSTPQIETSPPVDFLYSPRWVERNLQPSDPANAVVASGEVLIVAECGRAGDAFVEALTARYGGRRVITLGLGDNLQQSGRALVARPDNPSAIDEFVTQLPASLSEIIFLSGLMPQPAIPADLAELEAGQQASLFSFLRLVKALLRLGFGERKLRLRVVTNGVQAVLPGERNRPVAAGLVGLSRTVSNECRRWQVSQIDLRLDLDGNPDWRASIDELVRAILAEPPRVPGEEVASRSGRRFVLSQQPYSPPHIGAGRSPFRERGVYLILGGCGGLGFELSRYLASTVQARLILVGRRPPDTAIEENIAEVERRGGEALYVCADITDEANLSDGLKQARARFGPIQGAVHSAGVLADGLLSKLDEAAFRAVLAPKVAGTVVLHRVLKSDPLDFLLFFSSAQSLLGNAGQGNYAAACTFKDAYAQALRKELACPVKILNWGYWGSVGVVASEDYRERMAALGVNSITPAEGMEVIRIALMPEAPEQIFAVKAEDRFLDEIGLPLRHSAQTYPERIPSLIEKTMNLVANSGGA